MYLVSRTSNSQCDVWCRKVLSPGREGIGTGEKDLVEHLVASQALRGVTYTITTLDLTRSCEVVLTFSQRGN